MCTAFLTSKLEDRKSHLKVLFLIYFISYFRTFNPQIPFFHVGITVGKILNSIKRSNFITKSYIFHNWKKLIEFQIALAIFAEKKINIKNLFIFFNLNLTSVYFCVQLKKYIEINAI